MSLQSRWKSWIGMSVEERLFLLEAAVALTVTRLVVAFALRRGTRWMLKKERPGLKPQLLVQRQVRCGIRMASSIVPWRSLCLPEAMAAKLMLSRRGFPSTLHLGAGFKESGSLHAHAWLECGGMIIAGEKGMHAVVPFPSADA